MSSRQVVEILKQLTADGPIAQQLAESMQRLYAEAREREEFPMTPPVIHEFLARS